MSVFSCRSLTSANATDRQKTSSRKPLKWWAKSESKFRYEQMPSVVRKSVLICYLFQSGDLKPRSYLETRLSEACRGLLNVLLLAPDADGNPAGFMQQGVGALRGSLAQDAERRPALLVDILGAVVALLSGRVPFDTGNTYNGISWHKQ